MNLGPMMPGMPGMAGARFPTPFGRMTDGTNQAGVADQMQISGQMPPGMMEQIQNQMANNNNNNNNMAGMGNSGASFNPIMSNDKMVMAS